MKEKSPAELLAQQKAFYSVDLVNSFEDYFDPKLSETEIDRMAELIVEFVQGWDEMYTALESRPHLVPPNWSPPGFVRAGDGDAIAEFDSKNNEILLYMARLRLFTKSPIDKPITMKVQGFTFKATARQMLRLAGAHEFRHALETEGDEDDELDFQSMTMAEYRAIPKEYRSLGWEIYFAKKNKFPAELIQALETMLKEAITLKKKRKIDLMTTQPTDAQ